MQSMQKTIRDQVNKAVENKLADVRSNQSSLEKKVTENQSKNEERFQAIENELKNKQVKQDHDQTKDVTQKKA